MAPETIEVDYLVIGAGAMGLAFVDSLLATAKGCTVALVDRRGHPGGHWNDAYPYVRLHGPSHFYGVNSRALETSKKPQPDGMFELASQDEILTYYRRIVEGMVASGRVRYLAKCAAEFQQPRQAEEGGCTRVVSLVEPTLSWAVRARRKVVDASYMNVEVPAARPPPFPVAPGALLIPPNLLPRVAAPHEKYVVIGSGKTGTDAVLWMLRHGIAPERVHWVMPRDCWMINRAMMQPGKLFSLGRLMFETIVDMKTWQDWFLGLEKANFMIRLDTSRFPEQYHCSTVSEAEIALLRTLPAGNIIRKGRVRNVGEDALELDGGSFPTGQGSLLVDCTANSLSRRPAVRVWDGARVTLQPLSTCQQVFSAALLGHIEGLWPDDEARKNGLATPVPHPDRPIDMISNTLAEHRNNDAWQAAGLALGPWLFRSRLSPISHDGVWKLLSSGIIPLVLRGTKTKMIANLERIYIESFEVPEGSGLEHFYPATLKGAAHTPKAKL